MHPAAGCIQLEFSVAWPQSKPAEDVFMPELPD